MGVQTGELETVTRRKTAADVAHRINRNTKLVRFQSGGNMRMTARVDVGIDAQCDTDTCVPFTCETIDAIEFAF